MSLHSATVTGVAAGVPFIAVPPAAGPSASAPAVLAWHLLDAPRSEEALAAALPLAGLHAWRIYLGLPLSGSRLPAGGMEELMRLGMEDAVLNLHGPIVQQAAAEAAPALAEIRTRVGIEASPLAVLGGSAGAAVAQLVVADDILRAEAAVLISPLVQLRPTVDAVAAQYGFTYTWTPAADAVAARLDFVARADELSRTEPAVLLVVGADDEPTFTQSAVALHDALRARYTDPNRVELVRVAGMGHGFAEEPGMQAAPQTLEAATVDEHAVRWLTAHL